jgi:hypothetical protein
VVDHDRAITRQLRPAPDLQFIGRDVHGAWPMAAFERLPLAYIEDDRLSGCLLELLERDRLCCRVSTCPYGGRRRWRPCGDDDCAGRGLGRAGQPGISSGSKTTPFPSRTWK